MSDYRKIAFDHHGKQCSDCGSEKELHVHHRDGNHSNNQPENLEVLCKDCHWNRHRDEVAERASGPKRKRGETYGKTEEYRQKVAERMSGPRDPREDSDE